MPAANPDLEWAIEDVRSRIPRYSLYRQYDEGDHRLLFATEKYRNAFGDLFREFADNLCEDVVDGITDRLQIIGWTAQDKGLNSAADDVWEKNQGEARSGAVHRNGFREGDGFTIVQVGKDQRARTYRQNPTQMAVRYSTEAPDEMDLAAKVWKAGSRYRANLYYPGGLTMKFATKGTGADGGMPKAAAFQPLKEGDPALGDADSYADDSGDTLPVYHYPNGELSAYGKSILRGVIPLQDALNKAVADMLVTMEGHAAPLRWGTGIEVERDVITGQEVDPFKRANQPGSILRTGSKEAAFGQFDASDLSGFLDVQDSFKVEIARKGYLPPYAIPLRGTGSGTAPSGISLLVSEGRTIKLALDRQRDWGAEHRREMAHLVRLDLGTQDVSAEDLECEWAPPETRDEKALLETLVLKKELGVPARQVLLEMGYKSDEVDDFLDEAAETEAGQAAVLSVLQGGRPGVSPAAAQTLNSNLGVPPGPVPPNGTQTALAGS